jgi:hypothetical protein
MEPKFLVPVQWLLRTLCSVFCYQILRGFYFHVSISPYFFLLTSALGHFAISYDYLSSSTINKSKNEKLNVHQVSANDLHIRQRRVYFM